MIDQKKNTLESLSKRGMNLAMNPARIDMELFQEASANIYHPQENPEGAFPLNIAENSITSHLIQERIEKIMGQGKMPSWVLKYTHSLGHPEVREVMASFMRRHFHSQAIEADTLAFSAGASASLEVCSFVLSNPGDVVAIPAPSYPMYTKDLGIKSQMERYNIQTHHDIAGHSSLALVDISHLDKAWDELKQQGKVFKILLLTSPDNPTGTVYSKQHLVRIAEWCIEKKVHLVVNEIYAHSLIDTTHPSIKADFGKHENYYSFTQLMESYQSDYLHLIYALSKDFAISGFRFGIVHSLNKAVINAISNVNITQMVSNLAQWVVGELFRDENFVDTYIEENKRQLTESYATTVRVLREMGIPYVPSRGSLFIWADFSQYLKEDSAKGEEELWTAIYSKTGLLLTPGTGFMHEKYGLFRIVYTAVPLAYLKVALDRLVNFDGI